MNSKTEAAIPGIHERLEAGAVEALTGTAPAPQRVAVLLEWSRSAAAAAAASLANTAGGIVIVGGAVDGAGVVRGFPGTTVASEELAAVAEDLGVAGRHLVVADIVEVAGARVGVLRVAECLAPPALVETEGAIYRRTEAGIARLLTRAELDLLVSKDRLLRARAETNLNAMIRRNTLDHFNFLTIAVTIAPRMAGPGPYAWARANSAALIDHLRGFAQRWGLAAEHVSASAGEIMVARPEEVTGFVRISRNGTVAAGEHLRRPPNARFVGAAELGERLAETAELAMLPSRETASNLVLGALSLEGVRDLRLAVGDGLAAPASKDSATIMLPERYPADDGEVAQFRADLLAAAGGVFGADLASGAGVPFGGQAVDSTRDARTWHGTTKRTERREAGQRGHGSAR